jgi:hypothetical protein
VIAGATHARRLRSSRSSQRNPPPPGAPLDNKPASANDGLAGGSMPRYRMTVRDGQSKAVRAAGADRPRSIWAQVAELVARGRHPVVRLPRACEIVEPSRPRGRPRIHPVGAKRGHGYNLITGSGRPMRCRRPGCARTLKKNATSICCSASCERQLRHDCLDLLDVLDRRVEARHLAPRLRDRHGGWLTRLESGR